MSAVPRLLGFVSEKLILKSKEHELKCKINYF